MSTHSYSRLWIHHRKRTYSGCLLSGIAWNGELRETIKMVPRSIRRP